MREVREFGRVEREFRECHDCLFQSLSSAEEGVSGTLRNSYQPSVVHEVGENPVLNCILGYLEGFKAARRGDVTTHSRRTDLALELEKHCKDGVGEEALQRSSASTVQSREVFDE